MEPNGHDRSRAARVTQTQASLSWGPAGEPAGPQWLSQQMFSKIGNELLGAETLPALSMALRKNVLVPSTTP